MWQFFLPTKLVFGRESVNLLGELIKPLGRNVFIVTGKKSLRKTGLLDKISQILQKENFRFFLFDEVSPEPDTQIVDKAVSLIKQEGCDIVLGIGGGSAIDVAKAVAGLALVDDFTTVADYLEGEGDKKLARDGLPFISIPTVPGTGAEVTKNSVIINRKTKSKRSFRSDYLWARAAIVDPTLALGLPQRILAQSGIDALTHLIEGYVSRKSNPLTDALALEGIYLLSKNLVVSYKETSCIEAMEKVCLASVLGGIVLSNSGLGIAHGISPNLGAIYGIPHGLANGILLPYVMEFNLPAVAEKFSRVANCLGEKTSGNTQFEAGEKAIRAVRRLLELLEIPSDLKGFCIEKKVLPELAERSLHSNSTKGNPREASYQDLLALLEAIV